MSVEEDDKEYELKDLIVQTLETSGLLSKIKAQIRSNVFKTIDEADKNDAKNDALHNIAAKRALNAPEGRTAAALVREFLESANLDYTISVFDPELNAAVGLEKRDKLLSNFKLKETDSTRDLPLLVELLKNYSTGPRENKKEIFNQNIIDLIKAKFDSLDNPKRGILASKLFVDLFPNFSSLHSHHASVNNTVILDWNLSMATCSFFGDTIFLHKFRHADNLKNSIFIRLVNDNKLTSLKVDLNHTIYDLKNLISKHTKIDPLNQVLHYENKILDDIDKRMCDYGVKNDCIIKVKQKVCGGLSIGSVVFADLSANGKFIKLTDDGPNWRTVSKGLNLFAICTNS
ncbi:unnamed protein product [Brachionus calyciflorus]|uniref:Ubiquitin-like domain-containing protein n=1 Tax=Brachionus calyciflorus TaxID=104777 RepID=A0A814IS14_9BILA|nr:unnamed protein product [Brachionus calyciflorus]